MVGVEHEPDLALSLLPAQPLRVNLADHPVELRPDHGEREALPDLVEHRLAGLLIENFPHLRSVTLLRVEDAVRKRWVEC
jgi:hypothetical protein